MVRKLEPMKIFSRDYSILSHKATKFIYYGTPDVPPPTKGLSHPDSGVIPFFQSCTSLPQNKMGYIQPMEMEMASWQGYNVLGFIFSS